MNIQPFNFNGNNLSVIINENNDPLFVAKEVCEILGLSNTTKALYALDEDEKPKRMIYTSGQNRMVNLITKKGLHQLLAGSRKPIAKEIILDLDKNSDPINNFIKDHNLTVKFNEDNEPLFVPKEVCDILSISGYRDAVARLDKDEKVTLKLDTNGGPQNKTLITKKGLFKLLSNSRKPIAKEIIEKFDNSIILQKRIPLQTKFSLGLKEHIKIFLNGLDADERKICKPLITFQEEYNLKTINKRLDFYFKKLNVVVEYDEKAHKSKIEDDLVRESLIREELNNPTIIRVKEGEETDGVIRTITTLYKLILKQI